MKIEITKSKKIGQKPDDSKLGFGQIFADHMFNMDYNTEKGWYNARIEPYSPLILEPSTMVLHYGQAVFEGLKAFKTESGKIQLFRPDQNLKRLNNSCKRLCIPEVNENNVMQALKQLIKLEEKWIPKTIGTSLYIRPTIIATDNFLGVRPSKTYRFFIILSPVGSYYSSNFEPVKIAVTKQYVRAVRGGVGGVKTIGNYAASLLAGNKATKDGYNQVLWLDGVELKYIEEVGSMNIFFVINDEIITPKLTGSILPGITRDSVLYLVKNMGIKIIERKISIDEVTDAFDNGSLSEVFGSGTAAVISPTSVIKYKNKIMTIGDGKVGSITNKLYDTIVNIQYGKTDAPEGWIEFID